LHFQFQELDGIFCLFHGSMLQPIQVMLGWKCLNGKDITK
jgi:hypothetical protein